MNKLEEDVAKEKTTWNMRPFPQERRSTNEKTSKSISFLITSMWKSDMGFRQSCEHHRKAVYFGAIISGKKRERTKIKIKREGESG